MITTVIAISLLCAVLTFGDDQLEETLITTLCLELIVKKVYLDFYEIQRALPGLWCSDMGQYYLLFEPQKLI